MNQRQISILSQHCEIASAKAFAWNPVYAEIIKASSREVIGHIVSDGYNHENWTFYPRKDIRKADRLDYALRRAQAISGKTYRRTVHNKPIDSVVPKWVGKFYLKNIIDFDEKTS